MFVDTRSTFLPLPVHVRTTKVPSCTGPVAISAQGGPRLLAATPPTAGPDGPRHTLWAADTAHAPSQYGPLRLGSRPRGDDPRRARGQDGGARLELPHPERKGDVRAPYAG